jgi:hypothetical protein
LTPETIEHIKHLRQVKRYTVNDVARICGVTPQDVIDAMRNGHGNTDPGEDQIIDGERIGDRIKRKTALIRSGRLKIEGRTGAIEYVW